MIGETYLSSNHMTYTHHVVIDDIGKVVRWESIVLQDDLIIYDVVIEDHFSMHYILEHCLAFRNLHADDE